jgi:L-rhamnose-H+ transport protein
LGVDYLGMALGFAIIIGLAASIGTLVPLLVLSSVDLASPRGMTILTGIVVVLVGVALCSWAGKLREDMSPKAPGQVKPPGKKSYVLGLFVCILSGVLSCCGNLAFAFGSEMSTVAIKWGADPQYAANPLWALLTFPMLICNLVLCAYLFARHHSLPKFLTPGTGHNYLLAVSMGAMWLAGFILYGMGATRMGKLGSSVGWALVMSSMVLVANLWGLTTGEWRQAGSKPKQVMTAGLVILVLAMFLVGSGVK